MTDLEKDKILLLAHSVGKMARELQSIKRSLKEIADTPQTEEQFCIEHRCTHYYPQFGGCTNTGDCPHIKDEPQTDCPWE